MSRSHLKLNLQRSSYNRYSITGIEQDPRNQEQITELLKGSRKKENNQNDELEYINFGQEDQMEIYGYRMHPFKTAFTWLFIILSVGLLRLLFHWWPHWMLICTHSRTTLKDATKILLIEKYQDEHKSIYVKPVEIISTENIGNMTLEKNNEDVQVLRDISVQNKTPKLEVHIGNGVFKEMNSARIFDCKKWRYVWDDSRNQFLRLLGLDQGVSCATLHEQPGLTIENQHLRRIVYACNEMAVPVRGIITLLFLEVLNPFYIFQFLSFCLWFADDYMYYACAILIMSIISVIMAVIQTRKNQLRLHSTVHSRDVCIVVRGGGRGGQAETIPTEHLVPGDLLVLPPHGCVMYCDAVLLSGTCIVNESMLTGESVPVTKTPLPQNLNVTYDSKEHARHTIFCGTHVIQTRYYSSERVYALVVRTGFNTTKGALVRSILYPAPVDFKFEQDSYRFVSLLAAIASIGAIYTVVTKILSGTKIMKVAFESLDLITIVVPPALPAAMTIGHFYAQQRLQRKGIYCISPRTITISGSINCVCFDKTGTLTEDGLDMWGVVPVQTSRFTVPVKNIVTLDARDHLLLAMATCHSLTLIDENLTGDPLDIKMFESTEWVLEEPKVGDSSKFDMLVPKVVRPPSNQAEVADLEVGIMREFPFSSSLQRMSVVTRSLDPGARFHVYCKGAPETLISLSDPKTVPSDLNSVLEEYTEEGYRVLAVAHKPLDLNYVQAQRFDRKHFESNLIFLGLLIMENRLKPQSSHIIRQLSNANIRNIMVTGDNVLTALSVARDCGIIGYGERVISVNATANGLRYSLTSSSSSNVPSINNSQKSNDLEKSDRVATNVENQLAQETLEHSASFSSDRAILPSPSGCPQSPIFPNENQYCFAVTGHAWDAVRTHCPEELPYLVTRGAVFARMSPDQKQQLIQELQSLGYFVAMCGDGANDCGALKAAHAGISLSDAESSVASPFTSKNPDISCVPEVIREGRAALVTSFGIFKYMAAYSLTQFVSVMILYSIDSNLTDGEFLFIDLFIITTFSFFFGRTEAFDGPLFKRPPSLSLISLAPVMSLIFQIILVISLQVVAFFLVKNTSWYVPYQTLKLENEDYSGYENYAVFFISSMQYIILATVFSKGAPYRQAFFKNKGFLCTLVLLLSFSIYLVCAPAEWLAQQFELRMPPENSFIFILLGLFIINFVLAFFIEYFIVDYLISNKLRNKFRDPLKSKRKYLIYDKLLSNNMNWPPLSETNSEDVLSLSRSSDEAIPRSPRSKLSCIIEVPLDCKNLESKRSRHYSEGSGPNIPLKDSQTEILRGSDQALSRY